MKKFLRLVSVFLSIILFSSLFACNNLENMSYFNTIVSVEVDDKPLSTTTKSKIKEFLDYTDKTFSTSIANSIVSSFNSINQGDTITIDQETATLLTLCKDYYEFTNGKFNPAILPLSNLWGLSSQTFNKVILTKEPTLEQINSTLANCDNLDQVYSLDGLTLQKLNQHSMLDLGGIVKGYTSDVIFKMLKDDGHTSGYVNIGGSSLCIIDTEKELLITHPRNKGAHVASVSNSLLKNSCVSTSGDYQRYYFLDGKRYCHIIDPSTGKPIETGFASITVIANENTPMVYRNACFLDAISTSLCTLTIDEFVSFFNDKLSNVFVVGVYISDNEKKVLSNLTVDKDFFVLDNSFTSIKI